MRKSLEVNAQEPWCQCAKALVSSYWKAVRDGCWQLPTTWTATANNMDGNCQQRGRQLPTTWTAIAVHRTETLSCAMALGFYNVICKELAHYRRITTTMSTKTPNKTPQKHQTKYHKNTKQNATKTPNELHRRKASCHNGKAKNAK